MREYVKPLVITNEDVAEGVYAASGSVSGGVTVTKGNEEWGQNHFTVAISSDYLGKHIKITGVSSKTITNSWTQTALSSSGTSFTIESWSAASSYDLVLVGSNNESIEVVSTSIELVG